MITLYVAYNTYSGDIMYIGTLDEVEKFVNEDYYCSGYEIITMDKYGRGEYKRYAYSTFG